MSSYTPEVDKVTADYREILAAMIEKERLLREENAMLRSMLVSRGINEKAELAAAEKIRQEELQREEWYQEYQRMLRCKSWRMTRPLRLAHQFVKTFKVHGFRVAWTELRVHLGK